MRYLILSDIHANMQAFEAVLADAARIGYDAVLVLGDIVGYGADPGPAIDRVLALAPVALVRGNHDKVCAGLEPATSFNDIARESIEWTAASLSPAHLRVLADLPKGPRQIDANLEICHGSPFDEDYYVFDVRDAAYALDAAGARLSLFGHTHVPALFCAADEAFAAGSPFADGDLALPAGGPILINVGSVGQPRDGDARAAYGILDVARNVLSLRRVSYDVAAAQASILGAGLPEWLAVRLELGQ